MTFLVNNVVKTTTGEMCQTTDGSEQVSLCDLCLGICPGKYLSKCPVLLGGHTGHFTMRVSFKQPQFALSLGTYGRRLIDMNFVVDLRQIQDIYGTVVEAARAVNIDDRQWRRHMEPGRGRRARPYIRRKVQTVLQQHRPFPLGDFLRKSREWLVAEKARPGSDELRRCLEILDGFLSQQEPEDPALLLDYEYMRMMVAVSKALHRGPQRYWFGERTADHLTCAQVSAEKGMKIADTLLEANRRDDRVARLRAILFVNWTMLILEQSKLGEKQLLGVKLNAAAAAKILRKENALTKLKAFVIEFPFLWQAVYNGLEMASSLREDDDAKWFYFKLKELDSGFQDFDYSPGEVASISKEEGMKYFHDKYRSKFHTPNKE
jgi:hypothetical protein